MIVFSGVLLAENPIKAERLHNSRELSQQIVKKLVPRMMSISNSSNAFS